MTTTFGAGTRADPPWAKVWDPFVRLAHWTVALGFFVAYLSEDVLTLHVWAGYLVGVLVAARILWGFVGQRHARFSDFVTAPWAALGYLVGLFAGRSKRYLGHSPAGGLMVVALLGMLTAITLSGLTLYALDEGGGPFSSFVERAAPAAPQAIRAGRRTEERDNPRTELWKELHEVLANLTLLLVILHIAGVLLASRAHHENLIKAMLDGRKRAAE